MSGWTPTRVESTAEQTFDAPFERLFPLLCPVREYEWIDGWECHLVQSRSGLIEKGCIFVTHFLETGPMVWVTSEYDPGRGRIEFTRFLDQNCVSIMTIIVGRLAPNRCEVSFHVSYTSLNPQGDKIVEHLSRDGGEALRQERLLVFRKLDHFLRTGTKLMLSTRQERLEDR